MSTSKGAKFEQDASLFFHSQYLPLLVSPALLRRYGGGQIDLAFFKQQELYLCELKSNTGKVCFLQKKRLKNSSILMESAFNLNIKPFVVKKILPNRIVLLNLNL